MSCRRDEHTHTPHCTYGSFTSPCCISGPNKRDTGHFPFFGQCSLPCTSSRLVSKGLVLPVGWFYVEALSLSCLRTLTNVNINFGWDNIAPQEFKKMKLFSIVKFWKRKKHFRPFGNVTTVCRGVTSVHIPYVRNINSLLL
jgi:hypothetical protein